MAAPELDGPPAPAALGYLWGWFVELSTARGGSGFGGLNPIAYLEIDAWARLSGVELTAFELGVLRRLDHLFLTVQGDHGRHRSSHQHRNHRA